MIQAAKISLPSNEEMALQIKANPTEVGYYFKLGVC